MATIVSENGKSIESNDGDTRVPCSLCGRKFNSDRLERHIEICQKQMQKQRKVFDSSKQRSVVDGSGEPVTVVVNNVPPVPSKAKRTVKPTPKSEVKQMEKAPKSNWRAKHEEFIRTVRVARGETVDEPDVKRIPIGYVECPSCGRNFAKGAADRHIPWCKEQKARIPRSPGSSAMEMAKFKARSQYKAPPKKSERNNIDVQGSGYGQNGHVSSAASVGSRRNVQRSTSPTRKGSSRSQKVTTTSRVKARLQQEQSRQVLKTPIMKFKEKFPNHSKSSSTSDYIQQTDQLQELLKRPNTLSGPLLPRTVPGVRTGGVSPVKTSQIDDDELTKLKTRLEDMYTNANVNGKRYPTPSNGIVVKAFDADGVTRGSTSGSSDGGSASAMSRSHSSEAVGSRSNAGLPRFCHQCGTKYPITAAKYCYECGARRLGTVGSLISN